MVIYKDKKEELQVSTLFYRGRYRDVLDITLGGENSDTLSPFEKKFAICSLCFTGELFQANVFYNEWEKEFDDVDKIEINFFLGIENCRIGEYKNARKHFGENLKNSRTITKERALFFVNQGLAFFHYIRSQYLLSNEYAQKALLFATKINFEYGKLLSLDLIGHTDIKVGKINRGLESLKSAENLAKKIGAGSIRVANTLSTFIYKLQFGHEMQLNLIDILKRIDLIGIEDSYSKAQVLLEASRYLVLRGKGSLAKEALERAEEEIKGNSNRRQEILLLLRTSYISYLDGFFSHSLEKVKEAEKLIDSYVDSLLEIECLGLKLRILKEIDDTIIDHTLERIKRLSTQTHELINNKIINRYENVTATKVYPLKDGDKIGDLKNLAHVEKEKSIAPIIESGYYGIIRDAIKIDLGNPTVIILEELKSFMFIMGADVIYSDCEELSRSFISAKSFIQEDQKIKLDNPLLQKFKSILDDKFNFFFESLGEKIYRFYQFIDIRIIGPQS